MNLDLNLRPKTLSTKWAWHAHKVPQKIELGFVMNVKIKTTILTY